MTRSLFPLPRVKRGSADGTIHVTLSLAALDRPGVLPRPLVLRLIVLRHGRVAVTSTLHQALAIDSLPQLSDEGGVLPGSGEGARHHAWFDRSWPPEPLPDLHAEIRRAILLALNPRPILGDLHRAGVVSGDMIRRGAGGVDATRARSVADEYRRELWEIVSPHLDRRAIACSAPSGQGMPLYNAIAGDGVLCDLVEVAPMAGFLLMDATVAAPPPRLSLREALDHLIRQVPRPTADASCIPSLPLSAGFMAWTRRAPIRPTTVPYLWRPTQFRRLAVILAAAGDTLDPNHIRSFATDEEWYLFHAAALVLGPQAVPWVARNPGAAVRAADRLLAGRLTSYLREQPAVRAWERVAILRELSDAVQHVPESFRGVRSFARAVETSQEWHAASRAHDWDEMLKKAKTRPQLFPPGPVQSLDGGEYRLLYLRSSVDLIKETQAMGHCAAVYGDRCAAGSSFIYSVRDATGRRLATLELNPKGEIRQLRGPRNGAPPEAVSAWVESTITAALAATPPPPPRSSGSCSPP